MSNNSKELNVSFIIPAYNCEKYLEDCIKSILNQSLISYEIIIVNDGSTDNTWTIAKYYERKYLDFVKVFNKINGGAASARNFGMNHARGKYIIFVDSDDMILTALFEKSLIIAEKVKADIFINDMSLYLNGEIKKNELLASDNFINQNILEYISKLKKFPGSSCSKIFKKSFLKKNDIYFFEGIVNEDIDFMLTCFRKCTSIYHCSNSWYLYRQNVEHSVTNTLSSKSCIDMFKVMDKQLLETEKKDLEYISRILCYEYSTLFFYYYPLCRSDKYILRNNFKKYKYLLLCRGVKEKLIYQFYSIFGLNLTSNLINLIYKFRKEYL
ncbi:glycosyltransferase [bacterium]|nr:glycosyltransferase [bacterium]